MPGIAQGIGLGMPWRLTPLSAGGGGGGPPAGAIQAEDGTYLLLEDGNYLEHDP